MKIQLFRQPIPGEDVFIDYNHPLARGLQTALAGARLIGLGRDLITSGSFDTGQLYTAATGTGRFLSPNVIQDGTGQGASIATKFRCKSFAASYDQGIGKWAVPASGGCMGIHKDNQATDCKGFAGLYINAGGDGSLDRIVPADASTNWFESTYNSIACTFQNANKSLKLYKNGTSIASKTTFSSITEKSTNKAVLANDVGLSDFVIEYCYFYGRELTADEVNWLRYEPYAMMYTEIPVFYSFPGIIYPQLERNIRGLNRGLAA